MRPVALLEAGINSANQSVEMVPLTSIVDESGVPAETADRTPFTMRLLHFRRTFVENLFTLYDRVERAVRQSRSLRRDARHYHDQAMLLQRDETLQMLRSPEYEAICCQYRKLTERFFPGQVKFLPERMNLKISPALFPSEELKPMLETAYIQEAESLCYGAYPDFKEVLLRFERIREHL